MVLRHKLKTAGMLTVLLMSGTAVAQNNEPVSPERLARIENAIRDLQGVVYSAEGNSFDPSQVSGAAGPGAEPVGADMAVRVSQIERQLQLLTGDVERMTYQTEQNRQRLDALAEAISYMQQPTADAEDPMGGDSGMSGELSGGGSGMPSDLRGSGGSGAPTPLGAAGAAQTGDAMGTGLPAGVDSPFPVIEDDYVEPVDPDVAYEGAFDALLNGDYDAAEQGFSTFIAQHPEDPRAADAQYRLGEIYLATGANSRAAQAFLQHIKQWPEDARAPESYLKLGIAYARLDKNEEACQIFTVMENKFPDMSGELQNRLDIERGKAGC